MVFTRISLLASLGAVALTLAACSTPPPAPGVAPKPPATPAATAPASVPVPAPLPKVQFVPVSFADLPGWKQDDVRAAWPAFMASCSVLVKRVEWTEPCTVARHVKANDERAVRLFFETFFVPNQILGEDGRDEGLVTGYYEPLLHGKRKRGGRYQTPLYRVPSDLVSVDLAAIYPELKGMRLRGRLVGKKVVPYATRGDIAAAKAVNGNEIVWVDDPVEAFFLEVQGSGRVQIDGTRETVRLAYAEQNGYPYKSLGRHMIDQGLITQAEASAQGLKVWLDANPERRQEVLNANRSYVFFREERLADPGIGPKGSMGLPLTAKRSIAVDASLLPLGAPVYLSTTEPASTVPLRRLMVAQDTGGAIRGAVRADYFYGFGHEAGESAGRMKQTGSMWLLLPRQPAPR